MNKKFLHIFYSILPKEIMLFWLFWIICFSSFAQITIDFQFLDEETSKAISELDVYCETNQTLNKSAADGRLSIEVSQKGEYKFICYAGNYHLKNLKLNIQTDTTLTIRLHKLSIELTAIEIAAEKQERFAIKQLKDIEGTAIYAGKKTEVVVMDLTKGNLGNNVSRQIYAQIPGLNIYESSDGNLQLSVGGRGLDPNRTSNFNTRQNGYDISADVLGYPESYYSPPAEAIDEIEIIRGAASLQYGTQFGGLINFKLHHIPSFKKYDIKIANTVGAYGLFNSFNRFGFNTSKLSANFYYNFKSGNGYRQNSDFKLHNAHLHFKYDIAKQTSIEAETTFYNYLAQQAGGLTDQQFEANPKLSTSNRNWFAVNWWLYNVQFKHQFNTNHNISLNLFALDASRKAVGFRGNFSSPNALNQNPITAIDEQAENGDYILPRDIIAGTFKNYGAELRWLKENFIKNKKSVLLLGGKFYRANNSAIQGPGSTGINANFELRKIEFPDYANQSDYKFPNLNLAFFGENIFYINNKFSITPGFRLEYILTKAKGNYNRIVFDNAGNVDLNEVLFEEKSLPRLFPLFGIGTAFKATQNMEWYSNLSQNYRSVTFSDIRVLSPTFIVDSLISDENGFTLDVGLRGRVKKQFSYDVSAYSILYNDRIGIILDNRANRVRSNVGNAIIAGFESLISVNLEEVFFTTVKNIKLNTFVNMAYTFSRYYTSKANNVVGKKVEFIPALNLKAGINFGYKNFESNLQITTISSQFTDAQNSPPDVFGGSRSGIIGPIPAYSVVDFTASYKYKQFQFTAGVNNLFNKAYYTQRATGYPGPGIIPSVGISPFLTLVYVR